MSQLDLQRGARADEQFHLQHEKPSCLIQMKLGGFHRVVTWGNLYLADGSAGVFVSHSWGFGYSRRRLQVYYGTVKCDGTRTFMLRNGQLGGTATEQSQFVMTTTPSELQAFRVHHVDLIPTWENMGGS